MKLATLCYLKRPGQTLMLHRFVRDGDVHSDKWNGLGGKFEAHESPEECAIREVQEESGLTMIEPRLRGFLTFPLFAHNEDWYVFVFTSDRFTGTVRDCKEGTLEWVDNDELLALNLWEGDRHFLPLLEQHRLFSGKLWYKDGRLVSHEIILHR